MSVSVEPTLWHTVRGNVTEVTCSSRQIIDYGGQEMTPRRLSDRLFTHAMCTMQSKGLDRRPGHWTLNIGYRPDWTASRD